MYDSGVFVRPLRNHFRLLSGSSIHCFQILQIIYHSVPNFVHFRKSPKTPASMANSAFAASTRSQNRPVHGDGETRANANGAATVNCVCPIRDIVSKA
ncbi:hypothetical protein L596_027138 [Steinernema carpocapsae]|uniref:Uncharacterized protein n=1 Tax=Steinernema carpocapsae TaxID=34508 RepID=A0A4U5M3F9_STECR|nr:hypothetical protein L596_027138 [Steinernema carpocapsae]